MKSFSSLLAGLAASVALVGSAAASTIFPSVGLSRSFNGSSTSWNLFFVLEASDVETDLFLESPDGSFSSGPSGSSSTSLPTLDDWIERATEGPWRLRVGPEDEADEFEFSVGFSGLDEEAFGAVMVTLPSDLSAVPLGSSVSWTGPAGYDEIFFAILTPGNTRLFNTFLPGDATSFALPELSPGDYRLAITYRRDIENAEEVVVGDLNGIPVVNEEPLTWVHDSPWLTLESGARLDFTVIPEPSTALLGLAGGLLCLRRRR